MTSREPKTGGTHYVPLEDIEEYALEREALLAQGRGEYARAAVAYASLCDRLRSAGKRAPLASALLGYGETMREQGDYARSAALHEEGLALFRALQDPLGIAWSLHHLGEVAWCEKDVGRAGTLYQESLALFQTLPQTEHAIGRSLQSLARVCRANGDLDGAVALAEESLELIEAMSGDSRLMAVCYALLGGAAAAQGQMERAARLMGVVDGSITGKDNVLPAADWRQYQEDREALQAGLTPRVASALFAEGKRLSRAEARALAVRHERLAKRNGTAPASPRETVEGLRFEKTLLECLTEASLDGILVITRDGRIAAMNHRFVEMWGLPGEVLRTRDRSVVSAAIAGQVPDVEALVARGDYLHHHPMEAVMGELALKDGRVFEHYSAPVVSPDGAHYGRVGYYRDITERKRMIERIQQQEQALRVQVRELRSSRRQIVAGEERKRREIAELLHGPVQTRLLVAWHRLGQCADLLDSSPDQARALLQTAREELDSIREHEIRQASHLLHPTIIRIGLIAAVRTLVSRFEAYAPIRLEIDPALPRLDDVVANQLPETLRLAVYRVIEEALANVVRHAEASAVEVRLGITMPDDGRRLTLSVRDDGKGFDSEHAEPGLGMSTIAGHVEQVGGEWSIASAPGTGATLSAAFPLATDDH